MQPRPPEPPVLPADVVAALIAHAQASAAWHSEDVRRAAAHGHHPSPEQLLIVSGHEFMALWLEETYLD